MAMSKKLKPKKKKMGMIKGKFFSWHTLLLDSPLAIFIVFKTQTYKTGFIHSLTFSRIDNKCIKCYSCK